MEEFIVRRLRDRYNKVMSAEPSEKNDIKQNTLDCYAQACGYEGINDLITHEDS
jgi:hypothetical protein